MPTCLLDSFFERGVAHVQVARTVSSDIDWAEIMNQTMTEFDLISGCGKCGMIGSMPLEYFVMKVSEWEDVLDWKCSQ